MPYQADAAFAASLAAQDALAPFREQFWLPELNGRPAIYFCGNSLGLQPRGVADALDRELQRWREVGIEGFFTGERPWLYYHKYLQPTLAHIVGALPEEVVVMNTLTVNLHLLLVSFYRPDGGRYRILMEAGAFPSDQYAVESQVRYRGYEPSDAIIELAPPAGEERLRTEDILAAIDKHGPELALVLFGGVNYYTGQFYDLAAITRAAHKAGAVAGFDLAHAVGNVSLSLHDWGVDFAVWCSYKYLNAGPGGPGGLFVHERHGHRPELPRFAGWWGHDEAARFEMRKGFVPMTGAAGWQVSTAQILAFAAHRAGLELFARATMPALRAKSERLTGYLEFLLRRLIDRGAPFHIITPTDPAERGCQLSLYVNHNGRDLFDHITQAGVICDWREDNLSASGGGVIRVAPTPLYNTYQEVYRFSQILDRDLA